MRDAAEVPPEPYAAIERVIVVAAVVASDDQRLGC
jgi:hypothetical protein